MDKNTNLFINRQITSTIYTPPHTSTTSRSIKSKSTSSNALPPSQPIGMPSPPTRTSIPPIETSPSSHLESGHVDVSEDARGQRCGHHACAVVGGRDEGPVEWMGPAGAHPAPGTFFGDPLMGLLTEVFESLAVLSLPFGSVEDNKLVLTMY